MSVPNDFALLLDELREEISQAGNDQKKIVDSLKVYFHFYTSTAITINNDDVLL